jgi:hypothetical protein
MFPDDAILELTYMICAYALVSAVSRALRLEYDDLEDLVVEAAKVW